MKNKKIIIGLICAFTFCLIVWVTMIIGTAIIIWELCVNDIKIWYYTPKQVQAQVELRDYTEKINKLKDERLVLEDRLKSKWYVQADEAIAKWYIIIN